MTVILSGRTGLALLQTHQLTHTGTQIHRRKVQAHTAHTQVIKVLGDRVSLPLAPRSWNRYRTLSLVCLSFQFYVFQSECLVCCLGRLAGWLTAWLNVCLAAWLISRLTDKLGGSSFCLSGCLFFCNHCSVIPVCLAEHLSVIWLLHHCHYNSQTYISPSSTINKAVSRMHASIKA